MYYPNIMKTRREFLSIAAGSLFLADAASLFGAESRSRSRLLSLSSCKIGICDWDVRVAGRPGSFAVAKELGFEGVQVSFDISGPDALIDKVNRPKFLKAAKESNVEIASLCMGLLNGRPLATTPEAEGWVLYCLDAMDDMNIDQVLLAFFSEGDMNQLKEHQPLVIEKLKRLAPIAEKKKKILAIESYLSAEDNIKMLDAIGSDAIKVYYDVRNSQNKGYDIFREIELLGKKKLISQIHFKEDRYRLGEGDINFTKVCETLEKVGYKGWIIVESSVQGDWRESQVANVRYVKKLIGR